MGTCEHRRGRAQTKLGGPVFPGSSLGRDGFDVSVCFQNLEGATEGADQQSSIMPGVSWDPASLRHFINDPRERPTVPSLESQMVPDWEALGTTAGRLDKLMPELEGRKCMGSK